MKSRGKMRHAVSAQMRGVRELHRVSPKFFPLLTLYCLCSSIAPLCHHISHRLSSCKFCDEIAVFHAGNIVQRGFHDELVADEGGKYRRLWTAQAQYYTETAARAEKSQNNE